MEYSRDEGVLLPTLRYERLSPVLDSSVLSPDRLLWVRPAALCEGAQAAYGQVCMVRD